MTRDDAGPHATDRSREQPQGGCLSAVILAASVLAAAAILIVAVASSTPPSFAPPVTGPGPTTQLGVALLPNDPAAWHTPNG